MLLVKLFEDLAIRTWQRLRDAETFGISQGEESITDDLLLEFKRANLKEIHVLKTPKPTEARKGTDWEWWIGSRTLGWIRYAVQAKKLNVKSNRYTQLTEAVNGQLQIDILDRYAKANRAVPFYCFYNYYDEPDYRNFWQCPLVATPEQLGCTVSPSSTVRNAIEQYGCKTFKYLHSRNQTIPWRCLVCCPVIRSLYEPKPYPVDPYKVAIGRFGQDVYIHPQLPHGFELALETGTLLTLSSEAYDHDLGIFPKRILVVETPNEPMEPVKRERGYDTYPIHQDYSFEPTTVSVPAGIFLMGSTKAQVNKLPLDLHNRSIFVASEQPQHVVHLPNYSIGKYPVTNSEYQAFILDSGHEPPSHWKDKRCPEGKARHPVVNISWTSAVAYCIWLSEKTGKQYRLPTEAEWEKAARGIASFIYPWGNEWDDNKCNSKETGIGTTTEVGKYSPADNSPFGASDLAGNVSEWCLDWIGDYASGQRYVHYSSGKPIEAHVVKGGSFSCDRWSVRCAVRGWQGPGYPFDRLGFRLLLEVAE